MENGVLNEEIRSPSPIEEESFRQQIIKNRDKLRSDKSSDGFNSDTDQEWETEGGESDTAGESKKENKTESPKKMRLNLESSSSSSESSDSENEINPQTEILDLTSSNRKSSSSSSSDSENENIPYVKDGSDKNVQSEKNSFSDSEKEELSQAEISDATPHSSSSSSDSDNEDTSPTNEERDNNLLHDRKLSPPDSEIEEASKVETPDLTFRSRKSSSSSSSSSDSDNEDTIPNQEEESNDSPLDKNSRSSPSKSENAHVPQIQDIISPKDIESGHSSSSESEDEVSLEVDDDNNSSESSYSENEEPKGKCGSYDVSSPEILDDMDSVHSEDVGNDDKAVKEIPGSYRLRKSSQSSSSSSSESESENEVSEKDTTYHESKEKQPSKRDIDKDPTVNLPIVLDTSSSSSSESEDEQPKHSDPEKQLELPVLSDESQNTFEFPTQNDFSQHQTNEPELSQNDALHGKELVDNEPNLVNNSNDTSSSSSSSSSSDSETEDDIGPLVVRQKNDNESERDSGDLTPLLLRKALEEREKELKLKREKEKEAAALGARKPSEQSVVAEPTTPDYEHSYSPEAFDFNGDPSLRARTAFDFEEIPPELPPKLPPKQRDVTPIVAPKIGVHRETHARSAPTSAERQPIFQVKDKTASLGRGMWSDEEESGRLPSAHGNHPQADRVIDFSNNLEGEHFLKRSRSKSGRKKGSSRKRSKERRQSRSRSPSDSRGGHRVIDFRGKPYENPRDAINRQAMVSLHANNTYDTDAYDSVQETGDELNRLIEKANSLGYHNHYPGESEDVFPKTRVKEKNLDSKHQDAFAKIVAPLPLQVPPPAQKNYKSPSAHSDHHSSDNSKRSSRSFSKKKRKNNPPVEAIDGDDEISLAESDINRFASPSPPPPPQKQEPSIPFFTEIYPSDYTEFETVSEAEFIEPMNTERTDSYLSEGTIQEVHYNPALQTGGESAYDTVADQTDTDFAPKANLNPIVSSNFQICSDISGSKSFPARLREGKSNRDRPGMEHLAIPLNRSKKKKNLYPTSLPYFGHDFTEEDEDFDRVPRRTGSFDDIPAMYPIINPSIVVHRQPTHPKGYRPEFVEEVMVQTAPPLPEKKEKKKKEKKHKEIVEKPRPQIHLSVDGNENLNNNLQIQMLPSDDPNVINLNIRSTSVNPGGPRSLPVVTAQPIIHHQEQQPVLNTVNTPPFTSLPPQDNQRRIVEVSAPPMVVTGDELPPVQYSTGGGVMLAGGVPTEILPNPILSAAAQTYPATTIQQQQNLPYPTVSLGTVQPVMHVPPPPLPMTQSLPPNAPIGQQPVINTTVSSAPVQQPSLQPNNEATVVNVESPWPLPEDKHSSLPNSLRETKPGRIQHGDSGIDLTVHDKNRQSRSRTPHRRRRRRRSSSRSSARHDETSSSSDEGSRHRERPRSQKRLRSHDYLAPIEPTNEYMEWYKDKYMKPSCCYLFAKHLLFVINLIFTLAGLALVGFGVYGMVKLHQSGITDPAVIFPHPLFIAMALGFLIALVAFHGAAGFVRDNICMLKSFGSFLVILFILFTAGGIAFWAKLNDLKNIAISTTYNNNVALSYSLDLLQSTFECCGVNKASPRSTLYECATNETCHLPKSCCRHTIDKDLECLSSSALSHKLPCIDAMSISLKNNTPLVVGIWLAVWALMMIELLSVYFMCKEIRYLQKIRGFVADPVKHMETRQQIRNEDKKERGRRGSYHGKGAYSSQDERSSYGRRSHRGSSRSRSRRGS